MNDFSEIEAELKKLRPASLGTELTANIEQALAQQITKTPSSAVVRRRRRAREYWLSLGLGLAVAAGLLLLAQVRDPKEPIRQEKLAAVTPAPAEHAATNDTGFLPAGLTEVVYDTRDEGLQFPESASEPMRRVRYQTHEILRWRNPKTGASLRVSYPSEEVVLTPASGQ